MASKYIEGRKFQLLCDGCGTGLDQEIEAPETVADCDLQSWIDEQDKKIFSHCDKCSPKFIEQQAAKDIAASDEAALEEEVTRRLRDNMRAQILAERK